MSLVFAIAACGSGSSGDPDARSASYDARLPDGGGLPTEFGGTRPATLQIPSTYSPATPTPLVIALHGFFTDPGYVVPLLGIDTWYEDNGFLFIAPHGVADTDGNYYWNATDACCDLYDSGVDDVAYLAGLITEIQAAYNVDPKQIYVIGHSNGGFMAYRLACEHAELIAAVISFAGATFANPADCTPSEAVSVAQLHGTADGTIAYAGGDLIQGDNAGIAYPSASDTVAAWATYDGCSATTAAGANLDISNAADAETTVLRHTGCPSGVDAEMWSMDGAGHIASLVDAGRATFWSWFQAHAKP